MKLPETSPFRPTLPKIGPFHKTLLCPMICHYTTYDLFSRATRYRTLCKWCYSILDTLQVVLLDIVQNQDNYSISYKIRTTERSIALRCTHQRGPQLSTVMRRPTFITGMHQLSWAHVTPAGLCGLLQPSHLPPLSALRRVFLQSACDLPQVDASLGLATLAE